MPRPLPRPGEYEAVLAHVSEVKVSQSRRQYVVATYVTLPDGAVVTGVFSDAAPFIWAEAVPSPEEAHLAVGDRHHIRIQNDTWQGETRPRVHRARAETPLPPATITVDGFTFHRGERL